MAGRLAAFPDAGDGVVAAFVDQNGELDDLLARGGVAQFGVGGQVAFEGDGGAHDDRSFPL